MYLEEVIYQNNVKESKKCHSESILLGRILQGSRME
jgi:hypothetical protein